MMQWQMSWMSWGLSYTALPYEDFPEGIRAKFLIIGPLQMHWWGS